MKVKPLIGITTSQEKGDKPDIYTPGKQYAEAIAAAGGLPVILPVLDVCDILAETALHLDGLLLAGGIDIDSLSFGEEPHPKTGRIDPQRDFYEQEYIEYAHERNLPILGICRGCQMLNAVFGGTLFQDLESQLQGVLKHTQTAPRWYPTHTVRLAKESVLNGVYKQGEIRVNTFHHQGVKTPAPGFRIRGEAPDGVVEVIEYSGNQFMVGVQWHPELMWARYNESLALFKLFVENCSK